MVGAAVLVVWGFIAAAQLRMRRRNLQSPFASGGRRLGFGRSE
jgi:L-asparagine transporter-like permease